MIGPMPAAARPSTWRDVVVAVVRAGVDERPADHGRVEGDGGLRRPGRRGRPSRACRRARARCEWTSGSPREGTGALVGTRASRPPTDRKRHPNGRSRASRPRVGGAGYRPPVAALRIAQERARRAVTVAPGHAFLGRPVGSVLRRQPRRRRGPVPPGGRSGRRAGCRPVGPARPRRPRVRRRPRRCSWTGSAGSTRRCGWTTGRTRGRLPALCASYAAGVICCCPTDGAHLAAAEVRRGLITTAEHAVDVVTGCRALRGGRRRGRSRTSRRRRR